MDKKAPDFKQEDPLYHELFRQDLVLYVLRDGTIGTYLSVPVIVNNMLVSPQPSRCVEHLFPLLRIAENVVTFSLTYSNVIQNINYEYIAANLKDVTLSPKSEKELGSIDYSGKTTSGKIIAGVATLDLGLRKVVPDPILFWDDVPVEWSLEDAATVPLAYCVVRILFG